MAALMSEARGGLQGRAGVSEPHAEQDWCKRGAREAADPSILMTHARCPDTR